MARGDSPEGEAVRRPCGHEEDGVVRASHWRGHLEKAIEEEEEDYHTANYICSTEASSSLCKCFKRRSEEGGEGGCRGGGVGGWGVKPTRVPGT